MSRQPHSVFGHVAAFVLGSDPVYRERSIPAIVRLLVLVSAFYGIGSALINFWPAWRSGYQSYFRALGDAAFEQFLVWPNASIRFLDMNSPTIIEDIRASVPDPLDKPFPLPPRDKVKDTLMVMRNGALTPPELGLLRTSSQLMAYWPMLTIFALALATPWRWKRKLVLVLCCVVVAHAFIIGRLAVLALKGSFAVPSKRIRIVEISESSFSRLDRIESVLNDDPTLNFIAPVILWLLIVVALELWPVLKRRAAVLLGRSKFHDEGGYRRQTLAELEAAGRSSRKRERG